VWHRALVLHHDRRGESAPRSTPRSNVVSSPMAPRGSVSFHPGGCFHRSTTCRLSRRLATFEHEHHLSQTRSARSPSPDVSESLGRHHTQVGRGVSSPTQPYSTSSWSALEMPYRNAAPDRSAFAALLKACGGLEDLAVKTGMASASKGDNVFWKQMQS